MQCFATEVPESIQGFGLIKIYDMLSVLQCF